MIINSDRDLLAALELYEKWCKEKAGGTDSGIANMLGMLREQVFVHQLPFRGALIQRLVDHLRDHQQKAVGISADFALALKYVTDMIEFAPEQMDYDETLHYASFFLRRFDFESLNKENPEIRQITGVISVYLDSFDSRNSYYFTVVSGLYESETDEMKKWADDEGQTLHITATLKNYYNIPYYIGYLTQAFQEGAAIAKAIYDYIFSERSRGELSTLLPKNGPIVVDQSKNKWPWMPDNYYLIVGEEDEEPSITSLDPRFKEVMMNSKFRTF